MEEGKVYPVVVELKLTEQFLRDVLCTALEGGIGYWARARNIETEPAKDGVGDDYVSCTVVELDSDSGAKLLSSGRVDAEALAKAVGKVLAPKGVQLNSDIRQAIYEGATTNNARMIDADAADVLVQVAVFGEIVYS